MFPLYYHYMTHFISTKNSQWFPDIPSSTKAIHMPRGHLSGGGPGNDFAIRHWGMEVRENAATLYIV